MLRFFGALEGAAGSTGNRQQSWHHSCGMLLPTRANHRPTFGLRQPQGLGLGHRDWEAIFPFYRACGAEVSRAGRVWSPCVELVQVSPSLSSSSRRHLGRLILAHPPPSRLSRKPGALSCP